MSYVRWGSVIGTDVTLEKILEKMKQKSLKSFNITELQLETPGSYESDWYIFWHEGSGSEDKEDQLLAMWLSKEKRSPILPYGVVKEMLESDDWSPLGFENLRQKEVLVKAVKQWIADVEDN